MSDSTHPLFEPGRIGELTLRNRIIKAATFEGMCPGGLPSAELLEHHRAVAAGGAAMTTVAYCSVSPDGRTYGHQLLMTADVVAQLRELTAAIHDAGGLAALQIGHCGYFASKSVIGCRPIGPSRVFNTYGLSFCRAMGDDDIERVTDEFAVATERARDAGFDAVEVHAGHGYLLSQFLSPFTNRRQDRWGGELSNRLRFAVQVIQRIRQRVGEAYAVLVKMNVEDGFKKGLGVEEAVEVARALEAAGSSALVLSGGFVSKAPLYMLRGNVPTKEMVAVQDRWFRRAGLRLFGRFFVKEYPFKELFFQKDALKIRQAVSLPLVLAGGARSLEGMGEARRNGFEYLTLGRPLIMDAELPQKMQRGEVAASECDQCNRCIAEMDRGGVRCTTVDEARAAQRRAAAKET